MHSIYALPRQRLEDLHLNASHPPESKLHDPELSQHLRHLACDTPAPSCAISSNILQNIADANVESLLWLTTSSTGLGIPGWQMDIIRCARRWPLRRAWFVVWEAQLWAMLSPNDGADAFPPFQHLTHLSLLVHGTSKDPLVWMKTLPSVSLGGTLTHLHIYWREVWLPQQGFSECFTHFRALKVLAVRLTLSASDDAKLDGMPPDPRIVCYSTPLSLSALADAWRDYARGDQHDFWCKIEEVQARRLSYARQLEQLASQLI